MTESTELTKERKVRQRKSKYDDISPWSKEICTAISTSTKSLLWLCKKNSHWPCYDTIYGWINQDYQGFAEMYAAAKRMQAEFLVDDMLHIIDKPETYCDEAGNERNDVALMRLKIDTYKWQVSKLLPKKYGEKQQVDNTLTITHEQSIKELE